MNIREVYLVDDSSDQRLLIRTIFNKFLPGYHVRFFQGATELYQFLILQSAPDYQGRRPGVIVLDLKMPSINGYELLKLIRQTPDNGITNWATIPIVMLSANYTERDVVKCYEAGTNSFVVKPVDFEDFKTVVESICKYWMDRNHLPVIAAEGSSDLRISTN